MATSAGARTFDFSNDGRYLFATSNDSSYVVSVEILGDQMEIVDKVKVSSFPVGLAVSPDNYVVTTSQGKAGIGGGNAVDIIRWD